VDFFLVALPLLLVGCGALALPKPQHGGTASVSLPHPSAHPTNRAELRLSAPENPASLSRQSYDRTVTYGEVSPPRIITTPLLIRSGTNLLFTNQTTVLQASTNVTVTEEHQLTELGTTQEDHARKAWGATAMISAKLAAARPVQFLGFALIVAALAMFHPAVRVIVASQTTQWITGAVGLLLIFAPMVIPGNEPLLIVAGIAIPALWFIAHRHGQAKAPPTPTP
jgi:hypothetical protein